MRVIVFDQWDRLSALLKGMASGAAEERTQYELVRVTPSDGRVRLKDRAMNRLAASGAVTVEMPDAVPGRARDLLLRVEADGETSLRFVGAEAFESDEPSALDPPGAGETAVYFLTETAADRFLVARRRVEMIGT